MEHSWNKGSATVIQKGFTLLETILYIAVSSAIAVTLLQAISLLGDIRTRHIVANEVNDQALWAVERLREAVETIGIASPSQDVQETAVTFADASSFVLDDGAFHVRTATTSVPVTGFPVRITSVSFTHRGSGSFGILTASFSASYDRTAEQSPLYDYVRSYRTSIHE